MTPIIDRMERAYRGYLRRHPQHPAAVLVHPQDDAALDKEYQRLTPASSPFHSRHWKPSRVVFGQLEKYFKGLHVYADSRVPPGCVALLKHGMPVYL